MSSQPLASSAPLEPKLYFANERTFLHWCAGAPLPHRLRAASPHRPLRSPSQHCPLAPSELCAGASTTRLFWWVGAAPSVSPSR
eukprot:scaffold2462_cov121-Isochrysis_galbana.AAC.2